MRTDEEIVLLIQSGNSRMFEEIVSRYEKKIFASALKATENEQDALDVTQEIFIKTFKNLVQFKGYSTFSTWIYRISMNAIFDFIRQKKRDYQKKIAVQEAYKTIETFVPLGDSLNLGDENSSKIIDAVGLLPEIYRATVQKYYYEEQSCEQIARVMNVSVKTIESRLYRARKMLKENLTKEGAV